jgi:hypothetical protein
VNFREKANLHRKIPGVTLGLFGFQVKSSEISRIIGICWSVDCSTAASESSTNFGLKDSEGLYLS